jgi:hypothetical protein
MIKDIKVKDKIKSLINNREKLFKKMIKIKLHHWKINSLYKFKDVEFKSKEIDIIINGEDYLLRNKNISDFVNKINGKILRIKKNYFDQNIRGLKNKVLENEIDMEIKLQKNLSITNNKVKNKRNEIN